ncbi:MAG: MlrC C-terminal domain-containing protein [Aeromicrobium sp.]|nr:MlrC C-terminal domain-containing protein [Burkholderiales bacterium]
MRPIRYPASSKPTRSRKAHTTATLAVRSIAAGHRITLGPLALLRGAGTQVLVSVRQQCKGTAMFEVFGIDIAKARSVIVKSRGHFRAAFDLLFQTPALSRSMYRGSPHRCCRAWLIKTCRGRYSRWMQIRNGHHRGNSMNPNTGAPFQPFSFAEPHPYLCLNLKKFPFKSRHE